MSQIPEPSEATVRIPVKIVKGRIVYLYGKRRPPLREGAVGELVLPAQEVLDPDWLKPLKAERTVEIVPAGETLLLAMRAEGIPDAWRPHRATIDPEGRRNGFVPHIDGQATPPLFDTIDCDPTTPLTWGTDAFVEVRLREPLRLLLRGTKRAILRAGVCEVPALGRDATSVNHAYTLLSAVFEPGRRSHTGNVFDRVRYFADDHWRRLDDLRVEREAEEAARLMAEGRKRTRRARSPQGTLDLR